MVTVPNLVGGEHSGTIPMRSGVPQGSVISPLLFLLFVNDLPDFLEALTLLFADAVKMVTQRTQNMNLHSSLTAVWDPPINPAKCNYLTIGPDVPVRWLFFLISLAPSSLYPSL